MSKQDWPTYIKDTHSNWLLADALDVLKYSTTQSMNRAFDSYEFNPSLDYAKIDISEPLFNTFSRILDTDQILRSILVNIKEDVKPVKSHLELLKEIEAEKLRELKESFRALNSVMSSNFVVASSLIKSKTLRTISDFAIHHKKMELQLAWSTSLTGLALKKNMPTLVTEVVRVSMASHFTATKFFDERKAYQTLFNLRLFGEGKKVLAAIKGSVVPNAESMKIIQGQRDRAEIGLITQYIGAAAVAYAAAEGVYLGYMALSGADSALLGAGTAANPVGAMVLASTMLAVQSYYTFDLIKERGYRTEDIATLGYWPTWQHEWKDAERSDDWTGTLRKVLLISNPLIGMPMYAFRNFFGLG